MSSSHWRFPWSAALPSPGFTQVLTWFTTFYSCLFCLLEVIYIAGFIFRKEDSAVDQCDHRFLPSHGYTRCKAACRFSEPNVMLWGTEHCRISWKKIHQWSLFDKACKSGSVMLSINLSGGKGLGFLFSFLFLLVWETNKGNFNAASIRTLIELFWIVKQRVVARVTLPNKSYCNEKMIHPGLILTDCGTWTSIHTYDYTYMYWMCLIFFYKKKKLILSPL